MSSNGSAGQYICHLQLAVKTYVIHQFTQILVKRDNQTRFRISSLHHPDHRVEDKIQERDEQSRQQRQVQGCRLAAQL